MLIRERERENGWQRQNERLKTLRRGSTLIEVMVALFVVSVTSVGTYGMINTAFNSMRLMQDESMAHNLAYEGLEVAAGYRLTNLIRFGDVKCWNFDYFNFPPCDSSKRLEGKYRIEHSLNNSVFETKLASVSSGIIIENPPDPNEQKLNDQYLIGLKKSGAETFHTYVDLNDVQTGAADKTKFYRIVEISYEKIGNPLPLEDNKMIIKSAVKWMAGKDIKSLVLEEAAFNEY